MKKHSIFFKIIYLIIAIQALMSCINKNVDPTFSIEIKAKSIRYIDTLDNNLIIGIVDESFLINSENGEIINKLSNYTPQNHQKRLCNTGKSFNPFVAKKCETEIIQNYKGYRITIEERNTNLRVSRNQFYCFNIYSEGKIVSKTRIVGEIPLLLLFYYLPTPNSVYVYCEYEGLKKRILKYSYDELIPH